MICKICNINLDLNNWLLSSQKRNHKVCKYCIRKDNNKRYIKNKSKYLNYYKNKRQEIKNNIFSYYGGKCNLCNENDYDKLSLDHISGNGRSDRKLILKTDSGSAYYKWVLKNKPNNLRLLCFNCNCAHNMTYYKLIIKEYINCKYCNSDYKIRKKVCAKCRYKIKFNYRIDLKREIYDVYGGECKCGCNQYRFLTIDHINNDGASHRRKIGFDIYNWLKSNNYPKEYQLLCYNCNYLKYKVALIYNDNEGK